MQQKRQKILGVILPHTDTGMLYMAKWLFSIRLKNWEEIESAGKTIKTRATLFNGCPKIDS